MLANRPYYSSGTEVRVGDRVCYKETAANVVFISDGEGGEFAPAYQDYFGYDTGIMLRDDNGGLTFIGEPTPDLEFGHR